MPHHNSYVDCFQFVDWLGPENYTAERSMKDVMELETLLAKIILQTLQEARQKNWEDVTLKQLQLDAPFVSALM